MNEQEIAALVAKIVAELGSADGCYQCDKDEEGLVPIGVSNRHIHLSQEDFETLFGAGATMTHFKDLSQPGQYACQEVMTLVGPGGAIERVRLLGPARKQTQVEISRTDTFVLKVSPPVRPSGDIKGSEKLVLVGPKGSVYLNEGVIIANRHIHLSRGHFDILFGKGYQLTKLKDLSQPGQYACKETLTLIGPSLRPIENVRVLGPTRGKSQVEISATDSYVLKVKPPVRESGNTAGSAPVIIVGPKGIVELKEGCIIANRHIHMSPSDAATFGVKDCDYVTVDVDGKRRTRWFDVQVRVHKDFRLEMHVDTDDANAAGIGNGSKVKIVK